MFGGRVPNFFFVNALLNNIMALGDFGKFCAVTILGTLDFGLWMVSKILDPGENDFWQRASLKMLLCMARVFEK